jgi:malonyl-CoA O-methyltransferase
LLYAEKPYKLEPMSLNAQSYTHYLTQLSGSFAKVADYYHQHAQLQQEVADDLCAQFELMNVQPRRILDLGSGTGFVSERLRSFFPHADYVGVDLAHAMLQCSVSDDFKVVADGHQLPFLPGTFSCIVSNLMMQWSPDLLGLMQEARRVLALEGIFMATSLGGASFPELTSLAEEFAWERWMNPLADMHDIGDVMAQAGFVEVVVSSLDYCLLFDTPLDVLTHFKRLGLMIKTPTHSGAVLRHSQVKQLLTAYQRFKTQDGRYPLTYQVVFCHGVRRDQVKKKGQGVVMVDSILGRKHGGY